MTKNIKSIYTNLSSKKSKLITLIMFVLSIISSCKHDDLGKKDNLNSEEELMANFILNTPYNTPAKQSRAIGEQEENYIESLYILAFKINKDKTETFEYAAEASVVDIAGSPTYTASVKIEDFEQRFVVVTNASAEVQSLINTINSLTNPSASDLEKSKILSYLKVELGLETSWNSINNSNFKALPMSGETDKIIIANNNEVPSYNVSVVRMLARIDVKLAETRVNSEGTTVDISSMTTDIFKLKSVRLYNYNDRGNITSPNLVNNVATATNIPADAKKDNSKPLIYTDFGSPGKTDVAMVGTIYTFEAKNYDTTNAANINSSDATCLVVGGLFNGEATETYYRIDFTKDDNITYLDILRNHIYSFNIVGVSARGEETPELAFNSDASNIKVEIIEWNSPNMNDVVFNGQDLLSVSKSNFTLTSDLILSAEQQNSITVFTNYVNTNGTAPSGWTLLKIENIDPTTNEITDITEDKDRWIYLNKTSGSANVLTTVFFAAIANGTGENRKAKVWFAAGPLKHAVYVTQTIYPELSLAVTDSDGEEIEELQFDGSNPVTKNIYVNWTPKASTLNVMANPISGNPFPSDAGAPVTGEITGANGTKTYTIQPSPITEEELAINPFMEKTSLVSFVVTNGVENKNKSIFIRQKKYNILFETQNEYPLNGLQHTFKVRSNYSWNIKSIKQFRLNGDSTITEIAENEFLNNSASDKLKVGTTGGYNIIGEEISFTPRDAIAMDEGFVDIVFADNEEILPDTTIRLTFYANLIARSNIVYKDGKLTFSETSSELSGIPENAQGVFFKWGSLVAIGSATGNNWSIVYAPEGVSGTPYINGNEEGINFTDDSPYEDDFVSYNGGVGYNESTGKGDICRYISDKGWVKGKWRLPISNEIRLYLDVSPEDVDAGNSNNQKRFGNTPQTGITSLDNNGMFEVNYGYFIGPNASTYSESQLNPKNPPERFIFFPAGGELTGSRVTGVARLGYMWNASSHGSNNAHTFRFNAGKDLGITNNPKGNAYSVRCVRAE